MELDDLKPLWTALDRSLVIQERLLRETLLRKVRFAQLPFVLGRAIEIACCLALLLAVVVVMARRGGDPLYLGLGVPLAGFVAAMTAVGAYSLVTGIALDCGGPVTSLQRSVARLKRVEYRALVAALLGGVVFWLPAALFALEAVTGLPVLARVDLAWLIGNVIFGGVVLVGGLALARRHGRSSRVIDALTGRSLRRMEQHLAELARFEREPASP